MSDFKYEAINAALAEAETILWNAEHAEVLNGVLSGKYPVVDGSSAYRMCTNEYKKFAQTANAFAEKINNGAADYPIKRFLLYVDISHDEFIAAWVALVDLSVGFGAFICGRDPRDGLVLAGPPDKAEFGQLSNLFMGVARCMSSWMAVRNAECEDYASPRPVRRRHERMACVRFRRVFIRPLRKSALGERYEITGDNCPHHHVRGHFRYVTKERPLFGNFNSPKCWGEFWVPEHWKGDEKNGRVVQDYVVNQPDA